MKYTITVIIGLPGSGKSTLAKTLLKPNTYFIENPCREYDHYKDALKSGKDDIIISDATMILVKKELIIRHLSKVFGTDIDIKWIFFENDRIAAWANHVKRCQKEVKYLDEAYFEHLSERYVIPEGEEAKPIYKGK
jgi:adenylate kinase family enzyme